MSLGADLLLATGRPSPELLYCLQGGGSLSVRPHRLLVASLAGLAVALTFAAVAWACVPQGSLSLNPDRGLAGANVLVSGSGFQAGTVDLRWDGASGTRLGQSVVGADGSFRNVPIKIPDGAEGNPGFHYVVAVGQGINPGDHGTHNAGLAPFQIVAPGSAPPPGVGPGPATASRRAKAIARCKRAYRSRLRRARRVSSRSRRASSRRKAKRYYRACVRRAKRRYPA
jgi:hypothetical protein